MMTFESKTTTSDNIEKGAHVLYFYEDIDKYIENVVSFIQKRISNGEYVVIAESQEFYQLILQKLGKVDQRLIHYIDNFEFYEMDKIFNYNKILGNLKSVFQSYIEEQNPVSFWGHVDWMPHEKVLQELHHYECSCDVTISELGFTTVCAYDSIRVPSNILIDMLKSHEFIMNDDELLRSSFYKKFNDHNPTLFPTLSKINELDSEKEFYKKKLDFVHVVSHEVRNPLTVIGAYAKLLEENERDPKKKAWLHAIQNNVIVIDNEISHIIHTEEMLSTDALWNKKLMLVSSALDDVVSIMSVKAETQNRNLQIDNRLHGNELILSNLLGFKLIMSNLISNAIKYSYEGSTVSLSLYSELDYLVIKVKDQGIGISKDQLQKLFIKYEKLNQETSGQGIGLFMVKKLVDHFQGTIKVESIEEKETTFTVILPLIQ